MFAFDPQTYGPECCELLTSRSGTEVGLGTPNTAAREKLARLTSSSLFGSQPIKDFNAANCCLAGLWLWHDFLDESHQLSQQIETSSGSFWHGIMHRREGDFTNSKYWFHRVGEHPIYPDLAVNSKQFKYADPAKQLKTVWTANRGWDPFAFVDMCEIAIQTNGTKAGNPSLMNTCREIAVLEFGLLFDHCYQQALGKI